MTYHRPRHSLGTRDLLASIERDRAARKVRAQVYLLAMAALALTGAYGMTLILAMALEYIRHWL
jgi:hypothetical protein